LHVAKQNSIQTASTLTELEKIGYQLQLGKGVNVTRNTEFRIQLGCMFQSEELLWRTAHQKRSQNNPTGIILKQKVLENIYIYEDQVVSFVGGLQQ
jgi:hypothetical protein